MRDLLTYLYKRQERLFGINGAQDLIPARPSAVAPGVPAVTSDSAMRHSAVWACLRLRADLISTMPVDTYVKVQGFDVQVPNSPILVNPGGDRVDILEWLYSSQIDLDRAGNCFGLITERNGFGAPMRIDLMPINVCSVIQKAGTIEYRIDGKVYPAEQVWHEKQWTISGLPVGLAPVAYAAWRVALDQSAQSFAQNWFSSGGVPKAHLKNVEQRTLAPETAAAIKERFVASVRGGDTFVTGQDWEYNPIQSENTGTEWLESQNAGVVDIARFFGVPADLIDAASKGSSVTYANITQRNLQFLIMNLDPAIRRREAALSRLLSRERFVKMNTSGLLRMDDEARARIFQTLIDARVLAPSEARQKENRQPFTPEQLAEYDRLFGPPRSNQPQPAAS